MKCISQIFRKFLNRLSIIIDIIFFGIKNDLKQEASIRTAMRFLIQKFKRKEISVLEIGTRFGDSAKVILKTLNIKKYIIIDPFISYEDYKIDDANKIMKNGDTIWSLVLIQNGSTYILTIVLYVFWCFEFKYVVILARKIHLQFETVRHNIGVYPYI